MTQNSTTSKPSTESDTATKKSRWFRLGRQAPQIDEFNELLNLYWAGPERRITGLTLRIIGINAAALVMLLVGIVYLGQYQNSLIEAKLKTFRTEIEIVSAALSEALFHQEPLATNESIDLADIPLAKRMISRVSQTMDQKIYLFDRNGIMTIDSEKIFGYADVRRYAGTEKNSLYAIQILVHMAKFILQFLPSRRTLPVFPGVHSIQAADYPDAADALLGNLSISAWQTKNERVQLVGAAPLTRGDTIVGVVMLTREAPDIGQDLGEVWLNILTAFLLTLILTTLLSIYLSNVIAYPLKKLARAADAVRRGKSKDTEIPDLSSRNDEIGELSIMLREMTQALWDRMDSIEHFAADVAHELKNPLTSLRSAVETVAVVKKDSDRLKLLDIIKHDVERMDRLISDISSLSRLDSELSRMALGPVDLKALLQNLVETYKNPLERGRGGQHHPLIEDIKIHVNFFNSGPVTVLGLRSRVLQVFDNLVTNAITFSPPGGHITIEVSQTRSMITVAVEDQGPGIPDNKLETIFERFYSERPQHEAYGKHSGLGLAICRQIVTALGGKIYAENIRDVAGKVRGARFVVILNAAP